MILVIFTSKTGKQYKQELSKLNEKMNEYIDFMKKSQADIIQNVFKNLYNKQVHLPITFLHVIIIFRDNKI